MTTLADLAGKVIASAEMRREEKVIFVGCGPVSTYWLEITTDDGFRLYVTMDSGFAPVNAVVVSPGGESHPVPVAGAAPPAGAAEDGAA